MKLIFLDIDGVLNSNEWFANSLPKDCGLGHLDPAAVERVNAIVDQVPEARIVISSTWRLIHDLDDIRGWLQIKGLKARIAGRTPELVTDRGMEIQALLTEWDGFPKLIDGIVILDDDSDMCHLSPWLVKTTFEKGLQDEHVEQAVKILNSPRPPR